MIACILFVGGVGYLLYSGLSSGSAYFVNVAEVQQIPLEKLTAIRLSGTVDAEGIERITKPAGIRFTLHDLKDATQSVAVIYNGTLPDGFKPGAEVTVEGRWSTRDNAFTVHTMTTKCPSKYKKENRT